MVCCTTCFSVQSDILCGVICGQSAKEVQIAFSIRGQVSDRCRVTLCGVLRESDTKPTGSDFWDFVEELAAPGSVDVTTCAQRAQGVPRPTYTAPAPIHKCQSQSEWDERNASHRLRLVPHIDSRRSLRFDAITRNVREGDQPLRIGRFTDRSGMGVSAANALGSNKLAFKSKVVSRAHAEIWCEAGGKFFIKDTKSSSGTFLNHVRLSAAAADSRPFELRDGDTLQLGVDYQGGNEDIYKCVRMRVEIGREWQMGANAFKYADFSPPTLFIGLLTSFV